MRPLIHTRVYIIYKLLSCMRIFIMTPAELQAYMAFLVAGVFPIYRPEFLAPGGGELPKRRRIISHHFSRVRVPRRLSFRTERSYRRKYGDTSLRSRITC